MHLRFAEASKHEANHGEVNHRLASGGLSLVVATESAIASQPKVRSTTQRRGNTLKV